MKTMKAIILALFLAVGVSGFSQERHGREDADSRHENRKEQYKAMKVGYLTEQLELTSSEAQKFWPVYNEFMDNMHGLEKEKAVASKKIMEGELTDDRAQTYLKQMQELDQKMMELKQEYNTKFLEILSIQKLAKLHAAEMGFKRYMLKQMGRQKGPKPKAMKE